MPIMPRMADLVAEAAADNANDMGAFLRGIMLEFRGSPAEFGEWMQEACDLAKGEPPDTVGDEDDWQWHFLSAVEELAINLLGSGKPERASVNSEKPNENGGR